MPYHLGKHGSCPASKPHAVLKEDGSVVPGGCHATREGALKHQRALTVNVTQREQSQVIKGLYDQSRER